MYVDNVLAALRKEARTLHPDDEISRCRHLEGCVLFYSTPSRTHFSYRELFGHFQLNLILYPTALTDLPTLDLISSTWQTRMLTALVWE